MVTVRFNRAMAPYNSGEHAGFDEDRVQRLERQGYVTRVGTSGMPASSLPSPAAPPPPPPAPLAPPRAPGKPGA